VLKMYRSQGGDWQSARTELAPEIIWVDLLNPRPEEIHFVERAAKVRMPTEASLSEIEASSRLRLDHHVLYLSSPVVTLDASGEAHLTPVGFVITAMSWSRYVFYVGAFRQRSPADRYRR
jgi:magnesium transporter